MKKILLIHPSQIFAPHWGKIYKVKPTILTLFSFLKQYNDIEVNVLDLEIEIGRPVSQEDVIKFKNRAEELISRYSFDIIGISCYTSLQYLSSIMIAEICKNLNSYCTVVVGGYHPSAVPSDFTYKKSPFDFIVIGEGELVLLNICKGRERKNKLPNIIRGRSLDLTDKIDLDWLNYKYCNGGKLKKVIIYLSKGCPFSCNFCMASTMNQRWKSYSISESIRQIDRVIDQLNPLRINILDPCFGVNKSWRREFLIKLIKKKNSKIFKVLPKIDGLEKEDIDLFAKLNFILGLSLESGSAKMIRIMNKSVRPIEYLKKCREILAYANKKKVCVRIPVIINHPGETHETFKETISYLKSLFSSCDKITSEICPSPFYLNPGSPIYLNLSHYKKRYGMVVGEKYWWKVVDGRDHQELAKDVIPSSDFREENIKEYWKKDIVEIINYCISKTPKEKRLFELVEDLIN